MMRRVTGLALTFSILLLALLGTPGGARSSGSAPPARPAVMGQGIATAAPAAGTAGVKPADETPQLWFVELASRPAADGTSRGVLRQEKAQFRTAARQAGVRLVERMAFETLWNGLSVAVAPADLAALARVPGVKALYPVVTLDLPATRSDLEPDLATALAMTGADVAQSELGYTGAGIRVAVIDTGIDYHHPDLGGCFGPGCRVETGFDFVGDAYNASDPAKLRPRPDPDPDDCNGHGTHVAGIIGASGAVTGVAPGVTFGAYRVFGCEGSTTADVLLAALEQAQADGMQIVNMSLGAAFQWPEYPSSQASDRLVDQGVVVVASIGNSGGSGVYSAGAPGVGRAVIGVAAHDNSHISALAFGLPDETLVPFLTLSVTDDPPTGGTTPELVHVGRGCAGDEYLGDPGGKVALIQRGTCTFEEKYQRAAANGAAGVVIYNNVAGLFAGGGVNGLPGIFGVGISRADGERILGLLSTGAVSMTWTGERVQAPNPTGGLISSFSSYGLSPDLDLKPDLGAPGGLIYAPYPLEKGAYAVLSGTSMSAPHVAGAAALLLEARPRTPARMVRTLLQNSAEPQPWWGNPGLGFLDNVHRQGAGLIQVDRAILAHTTVEPGKLALGESEHGPVTRTLRINNHGANNAVYQLSHQPALSTGGNTFAPGFYTGFATVDFSAASVTVPAGGRATVDVTITANPALPDGSQYGGYIVVTPADGGPVYRVPYAGFKGDYQSLVALTPTPAGFPWLARLVGDVFVQQVDGAVFTLAGGDVPYVLVHLDHHVSRLQVAVQGAAGGRPWRRVYELDYVGRNSTPMGVLALPWDGREMQGKRPILLPDGEYTLVVSVLKALGKEDRPEHWEHWTSPPFVIDRG